jgi:CubicO group peptidase (beta-lactamase class C family)
MKVILLLLFSLLLGSRVLAQPAPLPTATLTPLLDSAGIPGLSMAVITQKGVAWAKGFGVREAGKKAPVDQNTVFSAASLGKPVFAYLVLKLADEGKIDLDKPLYQYVPYRAIEHDERYKAITARLVLNHQTGFPNWRNGKLNLLFSPGKRFSYSGEGFVYLQGVVMTIMGKDVEELAQQYVFKPLGMSRSSYHWQAVFEDNYATPHNSFGRPESAPRFQETNVAFSLQTTAADYGRFLVALLTGEGLKPATAQALLAPQVTPHKTLHDTTQASTTIRWGLGIGLVQNTGEDAFWHWGDNGSYRCFAYVSRTRQQGIVYFTNSRHGLSILSALATRTRQRSVQPVADFLGYDTYRSPFVQVSRRLLTKGVVAAATPFLKTRSNTTQTGPRLTEEKVLELAAELTTSALGAQAVQILALGTTSYPQSMTLRKAYGYACLQQGDYPKAIQVLRQYLTANPADEASQALVQQLTTPATGNVTLRLPDFPTARCITLAGSFNGWQPLRTLFLRDGSGWRCTLQLPKGKYAYKIIVDGHWQTDPTNPQTESDGTGSTNSVLLVTND